MVKYLSLFFSGFGLVVIASINTWQLAHERFFDTFVFSFFSALIWSFTVRRVAFSSMYERVAYAVGASFGALSGLYVVRFLYN